MLHTLLSLSRRIISTCLIQTFGFHTQERTDQVQDPGKIVFIAHLIRFSLFSAKLVRILLLINVYLASKELGAQHGDNSRWRTRGFGMDSLKLSAYSLLSWRLGRF